MVKFYENAFSYEYTWSAVTLAYFLRYPNPYSTHVIASDVISRTIDADGRLHTTRLHLKRGKLPATLTRFIPSISESYILETSVIDPKTQIMETETRNLDHTGVLSVVENQRYVPDAEDKGSTWVRTTVRFDSRLGNARKALHAQQNHEEDTEKRGLWSGLASVSGWGKGNVQRTIELVGVRKMKENLTKSKEGMKIVLERLRKTGLLVQSGGFGAAGGLGLATGDERWKTIWRNVRGEIMDEE